MLLRFRYYYLLVFLLLSVFLQTSHAKFYCAERIENECERELKRQCYFDTERICFKHFDSNCDMELAACNYEKEYQPYPEKFCGSLQFMCNEEIDEYNWPPDYFEQQIINIRSTDNPYEGMF